MGTRSRMVVVVGALVAALTLPAASLRAADDATSVAGARVLAGPPARLAAPAGVRKLALGVSVNPGDRSAAAFDAYVDSVGGHTPAIWSIWAPWGNPGASAFPDAAFLNKLADAGTVPMIWWYPLNAADPGSQFKYRGIIKGHHDTYIREFATAAKEWGGTVLLRFAHEMNGPWFPWAAARKPNTPTRFINAWRHVWNIFKGPGGVGATNVRFVWSPNQPCVKCVPYTKIYPGDAYVDYAGFSSFNWSGKQPWKSMVQTFDLAYRKLRAVTRKPIIVAETGSSPEGGSKPRWIREGYPAVYARFPRIKLIVYFNVDSLTMANQRDWRLTTPARALTAYRAIVAQPRFQGVIR